MDLIFFFFFFFCLLCQLWLCFFVELDMLGYYGFQLSFNLLSNALILSGLYFDQVKMFNFHREYNLTRYTSINVFM